MKTVLGQLQCVEDSRRAALLLRPLRLEILRRSRQPVSASQVAAQLGLARQKVNYHVQALVRAGFLRKAGRRLKRNLVEQRYQATARTYVLTPRVLGPVAAGREEVGDRFSAEYLLALTAQVQNDLAFLIQDAASKEKRLPSLSLSSQLRFTSPEQRREFAEALQRALAGVIGRFSSPERGPGGDPASGRPYRLMLGCYPVPEGEERG